jgi:hypothetical protein
MKNKCLICKKNCEDVYCFRHKPRTTSSKKKTSSLELKELFLALWKKLPHYSQVSGKYLGNEPKTTYFHHILPKNKYPELAFDEENIILLTFEEHQMVEMDMYKYEEVNERREQLKLKYNL